MRSRPGTIESLSTATATCRPCNTESASPPRPRRRRRPRPSSRRDPRRRRRERRRKTSATRPTPTPPAATRVRDERRVRRLPPKRRVVVLALVVDRGVVDHLLRGVDDRDERLQRGLDDRRQRARRRRRERGRGPRERRRERVGEFRRAAVLRRHLRGDGDETKRAEARGVGVVRVRARADVRGGGGGGEQRRPVLRPARRVQRGRDRGRRRGPQHRVLRRRGVRQRAQKRLVRRPFRERLRGGQLAERPARVRAHHRRRGRSTIRAGAGAAGRRERWQHPLPRERAHDPLRRVRAEPPRHRAVRDQDAVVRRERGARVRGGNRAGVVGTGESEALEESQRDVARRRRRALRAASVRAAALLPLPAVVLAPGMRAAGAAALREQPQHVRRALSRRVELFVEAGRVVALRREVLSQVFLLVVAPILLVRGRHAQRGEDGLLEKTAKVRREEFKPGRGLGDSREEVEAQRALSVSGGDHDVGRSSVRRGVRRQPRVRERARERARVRAHRGERLVHVSAMPRHERHQGLDHALDRARARGAVRAGVVGV
eukprot:31308-Pelagococcus_subviridis.AAC.3